jgi:hypothetical protein
MKAKWILVVLLLAVVMEGCIVKSLHPFYTEKNVVFKQELMGTWKDQQTGTWQISPIKEKKSAYRMKVTSNEGISATFIAHLFELNNIVYLDFLPEEQDGKQVDLFAFHLIPSHSLARVKNIAGDRVRIEWLNEEWLSELFAENKIRIAHEVVHENEQKQDDKMYILTASTDELQKFILKYGNDPEAFTGKSEVVMDLKRVQ